MQVDIKNLSKSFGATRVLSDINLTVREGELCALLGPSGSGKTTLLRIIAGLDFPDGGALAFDGEDVVARSARDRQVGFVFQHYALFRHMTVQQNIAFGLEVRPRERRPEAARIRQRAGELLELVQLSGYGDRYPGQLSGGQRQRVALARALAIEPRILLLDEPFGALDARVRKEMRRWLRELQQQIGLTSIFVTHDQDEALELADRVAVMEHGEIIQYGPPREVYDHPATLGVYDFLGGANRLRASTRNGQVWVGEEALVPLAWADLPQADLLVRAHDLDVLPANATSGVLATVSRVALTGGIGVIDATLRDGQTVEVELPRWSLDRLDLAPGREIRLEPRRFSLFGLDAKPVEYQRAG